MEPHRDSRKRNFMREYFLSSRGIRHSQRKTWHNSTGVEGETCSKCQPSVGQTFVLDTVNSTIEIRNMKLHEEKNPSSMQNYKAARKLFELLVLKLFKKWRNWEKFAILKPGELNKYEWMLFADTRKAFWERNFGKASPLVDARDFTYFETASSSVPYHVPGHPWVVPSFEESFAAIIARSLTHGSCVCQETFL